MPKNTPFGAPRGAEKSKAGQATAPAPKQPEKRLFLLALLGGSLGANLGMHLFHHKTRHWYFRYSLPAIFAAQLALGVYLKFFR